MYIQERFEASIKLLFGEEFWSSADLQNLYCQVLADRDEDPTSKKCDRYGGCSSTIALMTLLRKKMRSQGLATTKIMDFDASSYKEKRIEYLKETPEFIQTFPNVFEFDKNREKENKKSADYDVDGWSYPAENRDDWILWYKPEEKYSHYYYNELDHHLSHLVGSIRKGVTCFRALDKGEKLLADKLFEKISNMSK